VQLAPPAPLAFAATSFPTSFSYSLVLTFFRVAARWLCALMLASGFSGQLNRRVISVRARQPAVTPMRELHRTRQTPWEAERRVQTTDGTALAGGISSPARRADASARIS
jgi:hypothetical protein